MIKFKKVKAQGFVSFIEETEFKFDRPGLNIIIAKNGSGKTTVFNLLYWVCYGEVLKDIKDISTWPRFRNDDYKGTLGQVKFEKGEDKYKIIRCKDYKGKIDGAKGSDRLFLYKNNKDISSRNKKDTQQEINKILGYTAGLFKNSILFGQRLKRLTQETGPEKKKVFDEAFESRFIKEARDKGLAKLEIKQGEFNELNTKITILENKTKANTQAYKQLKNEKIKLIEDRDKQLNKLNKKASEINTLIVEYSAILLKTCQRKLEKANRELQSLNNIGSEIEDLEKRELRESNLLLNLEHQFGIQENKVRGSKEKYKSIIKNCPRCGQKLPPEKIKKEKALIQEEIKGAKYEKEMLSIQIDKQKVVVSEILGNISSKKKDKDNITQLQIRIRNLEREETNLMGKDDNYKGAKIELKQTEEQIEYLNNKKIKINLKPLKEQLNKTQRIIDKIKPKWEEIKSEVENLKWAIDDVLGNKGLKAYIFDTMLKQLNELLKYYEQFIGYRVEFRINFESANKDIYTLCYIGEHPCFYEELSGAQAQLVDLATAFALNDLVTKGRPINIMLFDEAMDGFDEENADIVNDLIQNKSLTTNIFLISHDINLQSSSNKVIRMSYDKVKGQTIMKSL